MRALVGNDADGYQSVRHIAVVASTSGYNPTDLIEPFGDG